MGNQFTVRTFDESLDDALPYVNALVKEMKSLKERDAFAAETLDSLVNTIIGMDKVRLRKGVDVRSDPENPMANSNMKDKSLNVQLGAAASYLAGVIDGGKDQDQLAVLLSRFDDEVDNIKDGAMLKKAVLAIKTLVSKTKQPASETRVPSEPIENTFEHAFEKYDFNKESLNRIEQNTWVKNQWPLVYFIQNDAIKAAYVGESTNALSRIKNHLANPERRKLDKISIIGSDKFNKSATLDIESNLIQYIIAEGTFNLQNGNYGLVNHRYYQQDLYKNLFKEINVIQFYNW